MNRELKPKRSSEAISGKMKIAQHRECRGLVSVRLELHRTRLSAQHHAHWTHSSTAVEQASSLRRAGGTAEHSASVL